MNKTLWSCLLSAACIAATTVWIPAQAAPSAGVRAPAQGADTNERVQRRLAEVIAMLEGDDLTAEEQAKARKTLQDIVAQLRKTSASRRPSLAPVESGAPEVRAGEGLEVRRPRAASAQGGVAGVEVEGETPKGRRGRAVEGQRGGYEVEAPAVGTAPKAPKPSKEARAEAKRSKASQTPVAPPTPQTPKTRRAYADYEEVERAREGAAKARADATERPAPARALRGAPDAGGYAGPSLRTRTAPARARAAEADEAEIRAMIDEMRKEMREIRSLMQKIRQQAHDEEDDDGAPHSTFPQPPGQPPAPVPGAPFARFGGDSGYASPPAVPPPAAVPAAPRTRSHDSGSGFARQ
ncbi:MAG TPA: hypothetical protein VFT55_13845 [Planctomycetota bacterium]|nr:hypothetical protein [Planctomycetota bacterium]